MLKGTTKKEKWQYFKDYYLKIVLVIGIGVLFGIYFLYHSFFAYVEPDLTVVIVTDLELDTDKVGNELGEYLGNIQVEVEQVGASNAMSATVLPTRFAAGDIDLFLASEDVFQEYAQKSTMEDLETILSESQYQTLEKENLLVRVQTIEEDVHGNEQETDETITAGVVLDTSQWMRTYLENVTSFQAGIVINTNEMEDKIAGLEYFMEGIQ